MSPTGIESVRFGVFVQGRALHDWERETIELLRTTGAHGLFILSTAPLRRTKHALGAVACRIAGLPTPKPLEEANLQLDQPSIHCLVHATDTHVPGIQSEHQERIADSRLKFILFMGDGDVPNGLAACAELGVWQYARSSNAAGVYPFVDGLCCKADVVSFGLEQIAPDGGGRRLLAEGHFRARGERNRRVSAIVLAEARRWPLRVLRHYLLNGELPKLSLGVAATPIRKNEFALIFTLVCRDLLVNLKEKLNSYLVLETWNVGFARMNFPAVLAGGFPPAVTMLPRLEFGRYIADPFILSTAPVLRLLVEDFNYFECGRISEVTVHDPLGVPEANIEARLVSIHHLSYPFLFQEGGSTYCLPECYQSNASLLYRYESGALVPVAELLSNARATDGTIVFHDGLYWLFCGLEDDIDQVNLYLFFSDALTGDWSPHPLNPVKTDVRSSRSAGPIVKLNGELFRPAQDCSQSYGYGLAINRITKLSTTAFEESVVITLKPESISESCRGLHTVSFSDDMMVVDAKFYLVGFAPILLRILRRARRLFRK